MAPRMRTLDAAIALLKEADPDTSFTKHALRSMVLSGEIPSVTIGNRKRLINVDLLMERLNSPDMLAAKNTIGQVRRIRE